MAKKSSTRVAFISGASRGIGRAIANKFASMGFHLIVVSRTIKDLAQLKKSVENKFGTRCSIYCADLSQNDELCNVLNEIGKEHARIDVLVNNAGSFIPGKVSTQSADELDQLLRINLYAAWNITQWAIPMLLRGDKPLVLNVGSIAGLQSYPNGGAYSVSKYALIGFSKNLRIELQPKDIRVSTINPGATYTDSWKGMNLPKERFISVDDIAELCALCYSVSNNAVVEDIIVRPLRGDIRAEEF